jgi:hypothetical protein
MYIDYLFLGLISLATLIWAFFTLPSDDDDSQNDSSDSGGTESGGDSSPIDQPPTIAEDPLKDKTVQGNQDTPDTESAVP